MAPLYNQIENKIVKIKFIYIEKMLEIKSGDEKLKIELINYILNSVTLFVSFYGVIMFN